MSYMSPQFVYQLQLNYYCHSLLALDLSFLPLNNFWPPETVQLSNLCLLTHANLETISMVPFNSATSLQPVGSTYTYIYLKHLDCNRRPAQRMS